MIGRTASDIVAFALAGAMGALLGMLVLTVPAADAQSGAGARDAGDLTARVLAAAEKSVGKKMWTGYGLSSGTLGCAAALCNVLKLAGYPYAKSATVVTVRRQLLKGGVGVREISVKSTGEYGVDTKKLARVARPGDLIMGYMKTPDKPNAGGDAHCGVVAGEGEVYGNDWNDGIWKRVVVDKYFAWYHYVYVMKFEAR